MNKVPAKALKIWANTIVNNEENFVWFSVMSVVDYVDKVLIWDTGSNDRTVQIIKEIIKIKGDKIQFKEIGEVDKYRFSALRQEMLDQSQCDWVLILDGDEIWWDQSIKKLVSTINQKKDISGVVVPMKVSIGDIYHLQEENAGQYNILGRKGHLSLKAFSKKIPNLHVESPYGKEGFYGDSRPIQERGDIYYLEAPLLHTTHLKRSSEKRKYNKFKYEIGKKISKDWKLPEVLYKPAPFLVPDPWVKLSTADKVISSLLTPLRKVKRRFR